MNWITGFAAFILVVGVVAGVLLGGLNPWTDPAEAQVIYNEAEKQRKLDDLEYQKRAVQIEAEITEIEAQKQAELDRIAAEQAYQQGLLARQLAAYERRMVVLDSLLGLGGLALIGTGTGFAIIKVRAMKPAVRSKPASPRPAPPPHVSQTPPRRIPAAYEYMRRNARQRELLQRYIDMQNAGSLLTPSTMTKERYEKLPRAT